MNLKKKKRKEKKKRSFVYRFLSVSLFLSIFLSISLSVRVCAYVCFGGGGELLEFVVSFRAVALKKWPLCFVGATCTDDASMELFQNESIKWLNLLEKKSFLFFFLSILFLFVLCLFFFLEFFSFCVLFFVVLEMLYVYYNNHRSFRLLIHLVSPNIN